MFEMNHFKSIDELVKFFPTEQSCIDFLERQRWGDHVVSPYDPDSKVYKCKGNRYKCKNTGKYFNVRTNTIFENTKVSLRKWMLACYIVINAKKGVSSVQLAKFINVTQKTAWFMLQRIQNCFNIGEFYQFNLSSCIRQQNSLTAQFVSFSLANLANIFYPPRFLQ